MLPPADLAFAGRSSRQLRRAGLSGAPLRVALRGDALVLSGAEGGTLRIEAALTERARFGYVEGKHGRFYVTRIWPRGAAKPLILEPEKSDEPAYGRVMQAFAGRVAAVRGLAHIERGTSRIGALATLALLLSPVLAFTAIAVALVERDDWLGWAAGGAALWGLGALFILHYLKRQRPLPVAALSELSTYLPIGAPRLQAAVRGAVRLASPGQNESAPNSGALPRSSRREP